MTRRLIAVDAGDPAAVAAALHLALTADGPALLPHPFGMPPSDLPETVAQRIAVVIETSGSSGAPKRVALSADALLASAAASATALGGPGQWLLALPTHYIAGLGVLVRSIVAGTEPVVLPAGHFDPRAFVTAARRLDGDRRYASLVPVQLARLIELARVDADSAAVLRSFDRMLVGGQSAPVPLLADAASLGLAITRTYGSSETSGGCVYDGVPIATAKARSVGGELELSGPMLAEAYLGDPARSESAFHVTGGTRWYRTGDAGTVTDGIVAVTGRLDRVIISGGIKVSLDAVERIVQRMPTLENAVVLANAHPQWGETPVVVVTAAVPLEQLRRHVAAHLGAAASPSRLEVVDDIPLLSSGKPDRRRLAALVDPSTAPSGP